jgi:hypothetical protein
MMQTHLRLVIDNAIIPPPECDETFLDYCETLNRWHAVRPHNPQSELRLIAFEAYERYAPDVAATLDRRTWGFN